MWFLDRKYRPEQTLVGWLALNCYFGNQSMAENSPAKATAHFWFMMFGLITYLIIRIELHCAMQPDAPADVVPQGQRLGNN